MTKKNTYVTNQQPRRGTMLLSIILLVMAIAATIAAGIFSFIVILVDNCQRTFDERLLQLLKCHLPVWVGVAFFWFLWFLS
jgi:hypothetical protein